MVVVEEVYVLYDFECLLVGDDVVVVFGDCLYVFVVDCDFVVEWVEYWGEVGVDFGE